MRIRRLEFQIAWEEKEEVEEWKGRMGEVVCLFVCVIRCVKVSIDKAATHSYLLATDTSPTTLSSNFSLSFSLIFPSVSISPSISTYLSPLLAPR